MVGNKGWLSQVKQWIERDYPNLIPTDYEITSIDTIDYTEILHLVKNISVFRF